MTIMKRKTVISFLPFFILLVLLGYLLYTRFQVATTRFFDADEFTHLHWAANVARGQRPYVDFFTFFTPGFYWIIAPIFILFPGSPHVFMIARMIAFAIFCGILLLTGVLFSLIRSRTWAILPVVILAFLPMPYDKFLELRPDNLATLLALAGITLQIAGMLGAWRRHQSLVWFGAGFTLSLSMVVLVKTLPWLASSIAVALFDSGAIGRMRKVGMIRGMRQIWEGEYRWYIVGLAGPMAVLGMYLLSLGDFSTVWYSLTRLAFEANTLGRVYIMESHLFFFPNPAFYGGRWGITGPLVANHTIWMIGILVGVHRFVTPMITANGDIKRARAELLIGSIFILSAIGYVDFFPLKHSQYLIPIAIFIAVYTADAILVFLRWVRRHGRRIGAIGAIGMIGGTALLFGLENREVNAPKLGFSNTDQMKEIWRLRDTIPRGVEVVDFEGRLVFWRDAYEICCLPFGQFTRYLSRPPKPLRDVLEEKKVPYIFQGKTGRLGYLSAEDQWYIRTYYQPVAGWGEELWVRK